MANQDRHVGGDELREEDDTEGDYEDEMTFTVHRLAAQVNNLQLQVATLHASFSESLELQRNLLQHLENQPGTRFTRDVHTRPVYTSTPATHIIQAATGAPSTASYRGNSSQATGNTSANSFIHHSRLTPEKFEGDGKIQPDDWLQSVSLCKTALDMTDPQLFMELSTLLGGEPKKWFTAMRPHLSSWAQFSELFRQAFLPTDNQERIWRGILDRIQMPNEPLPTFVTHLVGEFRRLKQPPSEAEQIELIRRHVSDQYRLALYGSSLSSITGLLLKAHELHAALGPITTVTQGPEDQPRSRLNVYCFKCSTPGVTVRNCHNCKQGRGQNLEPDPRKSDTGDSVGVQGLSDTTGENGGASGRELGARPRLNQRNNRPFRRRQEPNTEHQSQEPPPTLSLIQRRSDKPWSAPLTTKVFVRRVPLTATLDTGASISAVHPSTLEQCCLEDDVIMPWTLSPLELADSKCCTPTGLVWLPVYLSGRKFSHRFAIITDLSCPILLGTDFMIQADVHVHPATGSVRIGENAAKDEVFFQQPPDDTTTLEGHLAGVKFSDAEGALVTKVSEANLTEDEKSRLLHSLEGFVHLFDGNLGHTSLVEHSIDTGSAKPVCLPPYRASPKKRRIIEEQIAKMITDDIIEPASGPWASPIVIVEKPSSEPRFCIDFRKINLSTVKDSYPLPRVDESLDFLSRGKYISTLDLARGYWQVSVAPESRQKTAFISHKGLYQFKVMPFGLSNAPATFQRLMNSVLAGLIYNCCVVYLDDIVVASPTLEQHIEDLTVVLGRLADAGLSLKLGKCHFCKSSLRYLGYMVTPEGLSPDENKVSSIKDFPEPSSVKQVRQFLGMTSYYRRFISEYAKIAEPIISLTRDGVPFMWDETCRTALKHLKLCLTTAPVLVLPDFEKPFAIHTDACDVGLGAALVQTDDKGRERAVAFASRTLHKSERPYSTSEKECLGVIWALEHFRPYIEGSNVSVFTDHNSLRWLMSRPSPSGRLARWCLRLQDFEFEVFHKPGSANSIPDALSRNPVEGPVEAVDLLPPYATVGSLNLRRQPQLILDDKQQLKSLQVADETISSLRARLEDSCVDSSPFCIHEDLVYFKDKKATGLIHPYKDLRFYVPSSLRSTLLKYFHDHPMAGHLGITKTLGRLQKRVYWPGLRRDVKKYVRSCETCQFTKPTNRKPGGFMQPVIASYPWEVAGVDFVGPLPRSGRGNAYILVFIDYFTKWVEICPVREATAQVAAQKFISEVFSRHGAPTHIVSDRGTQFVSEFFESVVAALGSEHRLTTAYHPQSNQTERVNRTIKTAIRAYVGPKHREWDLYLPLISFALRTAPHQSTGDTPAYLLYGRDLHTPLDLWILPQAERTPENVQGYRSELTSSLRDAYDQVRNSLASSHAVQKKHYDKRRREVTFSTGDLVRLKTHPRSDAATGFTAKLAPLYKGPYRVSQVMSDLNYKLTRIGDGVDVGVYHVCNLLPFFTWDEGEVLVDQPDALQHVADDDLSGSMEETTGEEEYGFDFLFGHSDGPACPHDTPHSSTLTLPQLLGEPIGTQGVSLPNYESDPLASNASSESGAGPSDFSHQHPDNSRYAFRPRRTPRVTTDWSTNKWSHPYFASHFDV